MTTKCSLTCRRPPFHCPTSKCQILLQIVGAIYVFAVNPAGTADVIKKNMTEAMKKYGNAQSEGVTIVWNLAQQKLHCCGVTKGEKDWNDKGKPKGVNSCYKDAECKLPGKKPYADCEKGIAYSIKAFGFVDTVVWYKLAGGVAHWEI